MEKNIKKKKIYIDIKLNQFSVYLKQNIVNLLNFNKNF